MKVSVAAYAYIQLENHEQFREENRDGNHFIVQAIHGYDALDNEYQRVSLRGVGLRRVKGAVTGERLSINRETSRRVIDLPEHLRKMLPTAEVTYHHE